MTNAVDETLLANLGKRLQKEWSAWNMGVESAQLLEVFHHLKSFDVKTQLKIIVAVLSIADDDANPSSTSSKVQEYLQQNEAMSFGEWNLWVPIITACVSKRLLVSNGVSDEDTSTMKTAHTDSSNTLLDKASRKLAELLLSSSHITSSSSSSSPSTIPTNESLENLAQIDMVRKYFFHESVVANLDHTSSSSSSSSCCSYTREVEPDFLSREITAVEKRDSSRAAAVESSGFSFK